MKIWEYCEDVDHYAHLTFVDLAFTRELISEFTGKPYTKTWPTPTVDFAMDWEAPGLSGRERKIIRKQNEGLPEPDFPWLPGAEAAAVFSMRALQVLGVLLGSAVQILPLNCRSKEYSIVNIIEVIDCLDQEHSLFRHYGPTFNIIKPVFKPGMLQGKHIFKLPKPSSTIFVSDEFKKTVEINELSGLTWKIGSENSKES